ncbi:zinc-binding metallopeptidase family protein [Clostridium septicum]|uniref:Peptidase M20 domain-containing protein 2 n=1 Tax=Clostridium septicum TaxID=1504 RepID=A0A9N7PJ87_CLOSE|nr:amidohydrolase [Clostridium septicum]AYE34496.1 amidohydrolase [Clostridium septicum]MDU1315048.1 M20 family peptidase [Clostridium septicum]QAS59898.1 M20 family peptidase [Clostridium septicum]UEC20862.1 M20 family peptidase [Clostridium septicum]USS01088.1 M20 family peptidase [Clostridium septicum]
MKQEIISYLSTCRNDIFDLCKYLYDNPEDSYNEIKSCKYLSNLLTKYGFNVDNNFLDLSTSFYATKGSGHPKVCFLCEYDAIPGEGHITGHNLLSATSIAAAISLGNVIDKAGGSVIVIGCPGEYLGGTKSVMVKQGVFADIDVVLLAHPDIITSESGSSSAIIPLSVKFIGNSGLSFLNKGSYTSLDGILLTFNILNSLLKGFPEDVEVNSILSQGGFTPLLLPLESEAKFYIRAKEMDIAKIAEGKLREIIIYVSKLIRVQYSMSLYEPENEELITNRTLNRLFSHNLKESGTINISEPRDVYSGLSLGIVSKTVPCIHPYISIIENNAIKYGTKDFADATISDYALEQSIKAAQALAFTGLDIIQNENLLYEVKNEFYKK